MGSRPEEKQSTSLPRDPTTPSAEQTPGRLAADHSPWDLLGFWIQIGANGQEPLMTPI